MKAKALRHLNFGITFEIIIVDLKYPLVYRLPWGQGFFVVDPRSLSARYFGEENPFPKSYKGLKGLTTKGYAEFLEEQCHFGNDGFGRFVPLRYYRLGENPMFDLPPGVYNSADVLPPQEEPTANPSRPRTERSLKRQERLERRRRGV
jgi:hypothetical protein